MSGNLIYNGLGLELVPLPDEREPAMLDDKGRLLRPNMGEGNSIIRPFVIKYCVLPVFNLLFENTPKWKSR